MSNNKKVLIVDDFGDTGKILVQMFDHLNVPTESVDNPGDAFEKVAKHQYRLVIADSRMPKLDGVSLLKRIRERWPATKVAVMSTFNSGATQKLVAKDDIDYYLPKPINMGHLEKITRELALSK
jgi:DNA-binding NtrC family response regulator